jgi:zinc D-Ala-D-Ala carboxypeptidase
MLPTITCSTPQARLAGLIQASILVLMLACSPAQKPSTAPEPEPLPDPRELAFMAALGVLPPEQALAATAIFAADKERFFNLLAAAESESALAGDLLLLIDKSHGLAAEFEPADLVPLSDYNLRVSRNDLRLRRAIIDAVLALDRAARAEGLTLVFSSAYRSYQHQANLFSRYSGQFGEAEAGRFSARPGHSQHQLGTAVDFGSIDDSFASTAEGRWMSANAWRFGFSLSYPQNMEEFTGYIWESWHYRYITVPGALLEREYFGGIQQYFLAFLVEYRKSFTASTTS